MNTIIQDLIHARLRKENEHERETHTKSGKLSASQLGCPTQWQILNALKVKGKDVDNYTLGKFKRGNDVEDFIIKMLEKETYGIQMDCNYRDCVGKLDIELFGDRWGVDYLPVEVKSVTNAGFKWKEKSLKAQHTHKLQAGLYAMALNLPKFSVLYVASDDYRVLHFIYDTDTIKNEIDLIIDLFNSTMEDKTIPVFQAVEKWNENKMYNNFPEWQYLKEHQLKLKEKDLYKK